MNKSARKGAQLVEGREVTCFNAIAVGEGPCLYVLNRSLEFFRIFSYCQRNFEARF
jgi:hypothetical protein